MAVLVGLALVLTACGGGVRGTTSATTSAAAAAASRPQPAVEVRTESFVDSTRGTGAHSGLPATDTRSLPTKVFAPADGQPGRPYPLIVFAHGSGGLGTDYDVLLRTWAAAGYVVAAPAFPVATADAEPGAWIEDLPNLPADVSFVADQMVKSEAGLVDPGRIGAAGHSMGAMVTLTVAANTCCHDARVKAAVVLAGRETPGSGE
jgi:dipeptidyl aminopeptidase/acylaminoacyl peptidase